MSERLGFYKKVMLELNHQVLQKRIDEHELHQLFWECTLRCNLNCRHCGSDCRMLSEKDDMPFEDFAKVLDDTLKEINSDYEAKRQNDLALQPLEVIVARKNLFHDWLDGKGKLGGQHKIPRLSNTREYIEEMMQLNK